MSKQNKEPAVKVLLLDIETAPIIGYFWRLRDEVNGIDQIKSDWFILSWAAKWQHEDKIMYMDQRRKPDMEDDSDTLAGIWKLLEEADVVITHNGKQFDIKKLNARFLIQGFQPPTKFRHIDTYQIARNHFALTSNKLEYIANVLKTKHRKLKHTKFPGLELWKECLKRNVKAWNEMEKYNRFDVVVLEEVYDKLIPWDQSINFNVYSDSDKVVCTCGGEEFKKRGFHYTNTSKYQRFKCLGCGAETRSKVNLFSKEKRNSLRAKT